MQGIPILVSRLTCNGLKQVFTVRDPIDSSQSINNFQCQPPQFATLDNCRQRQNKVRIRRIQSSGSKRRFPKDFFSRESNRQNKKPDSKQKNTIQQQAKQTGCFAAMQEQNLNNFDNQTMQTPKFRQKNQTERYSQLYKNKTLKQTLIKAIIKKSKQKKPENKPMQKKVMSFQNTFSGKQLKELNTECAQLDLKAILQPRKQSSLGVKMKKVKQNCFKKFSFPKQKDNKVVQKNLRD